MQYISIDWYEKEIIHPIRFDFGRLVFVYPIAVNCARTFCHKCVCFARFFRDWRRQAPILITSALACNFAIFVSSSSFASGGIANLQSQSKSKARPLLFSCKVAALTKMKWDMYHELQTNRVWEKDKSQNTIQQLMWTNDVSLKEYWFIVIRHNHLCCDYY